MHLLAALVLTASLVLVPVRAALASNGPGAATPQLIQHAVASGQITSDTGALYLAWALASDGRLPQRFVSTAPWEGTPYLLQLRDRVRSMAPSAARTALVAAMAAPANAANSCGAYSGGASTYNSSHYTIDYGSIWAGLAVTDYAAALETSWNTEVTSFGWAAPPAKSSNPPPGDRYHIIIASLSGGLYGVTYNYGTYAGAVGDNPNTSWNEGDAYATCVVLNSDYTQFPGSPQQAMEATAAHEFNHSIQFGLGALNGANRPDSDFIEGGATWMEDEVFDTANDNYNYLWPDFTQSMGAYAPSPYPYWITFRGITERYGTGVSGGGEQIMQDFWEATSKNTGDNLTAMQTAVSNKGTTLANAFHAYAIAVKFNRPCGGGYPYPYCFEEGASYVAAAGATTVQGSIGSVGGSTSGSVRDDYALNWVSVPANAGTYSVSLHNTSSGGQLHASAVCDTGSGLQVNGFPAVVGAGESTTLSTFSSAGCTRAVVVITNQSQTAANPVSSSLRAYTLSTGSPGSSALSIGDVSVPEGNSGTTTASFPVTLSPASASTVTVDYATASGTATSGTDFVAASGTLTFTAGQTSKSIPVSVNGDTTVEPNETFSVNLSNASGAAIDDGQGTGTITNDDSAGAPPNDNFAAAQVIPGAPCTGTASDATCAGTNVGSTPESGEPNPAGHGSGHSVWYRWLAPSGGTATVDTNGSMFDTVLGVYTGSGFPLSLVADDDDSGTGLQSLVTFTASAGTTYRIEVDGFSGATGAVTLHVVLGGGGGCTITGTEGSDTLTGTAGDDVICGLGGNDVIRPRAGSDVISGGSGFDYVVYDDMSSRIIADLSEGRVYEYFAGGGIDEISGIEGVAGTPGADSLYGNGAANGLYGLAGNDHLYGKAGNDLLVGGPGGDWLTGGKGRDDCRGGPGVDHELSCEI